MSHLYIFPTMHHIPMKPQRSIFIMYQWQLNDPSSSYQWQLIDPSSSMHSHQGKYILYYINHQSINPLTSINHLTSINQTIGINENMIQQVPWKGAVDWKFSPQRSSPKRTDRDKVSLDYNISHGIFLSKGINNHLGGKIHKLILF